MAAPDEPKSDALTPNDVEFISNTLKWMEETLGDQAIVGHTENDWTYIVKLHAIIETALNDALIKQFNAPDLSKVIAKLDTSNTATGKVAFAKALKILDPSSVAFVQKLSELRNLCVHDIRNFKFDMDQHLASLTEEKRNELVKPILRMLRPETSNQIPLKGALFTGTMQVMFQLYLHHMRCETRALDAKLYLLQSRLYERGQSTATKG